MTPIETESIRWFESEEWEEGPAGWMEPTNQGGNYPKEFPTIDANYFFDVVVGRMRELGFWPEIINPTNRWCVSWHRTDDEIFRRCRTDEDIVLAGLKAANDAREAIGK